MSHTREHAIPSAQREDSARRGTRGVSAARDEDRLGAGWLMLLLPLACCGGPLLIGALAAAGGLVWGALGVGVAVALGAIFLGVRRRTARRCNPQPADVRSTTSRGPSSAGGA